MGVAVEHEIGVLLAEPLQLQKSVGLDMEAPRGSHGVEWTRRRVLPSASRRMRWEPLQAEPVEELRGRSRAGLQARLLAERAEEPFLVVAEDRVRLPLLQDRHDLVREAVFPDAVAEADEVVDVAHQPQRLGEACRVAVKVRDDTESHGRRCLGARPSLEESPFRATLLALPGDAEGRPARHHPSTTRLFRRMTRSPRPGFARIFGLEFRGLHSHFAPVQVNDALTLDFDERGDFDCHHYAFKVGDAEFDAIFTRVKDEGIAYGSGPRSRRHGDQSPPRRPGLLLRIPTATCWRY